MALNVLHIIDQYRIGGPGKTILNSAKFISAQRYRIHLASFREMGAGFNEILDHAQKLKIPCFELKDVRGFSLQHIWQLRTYIVSNKIDILHTHGYKTNFIGVLVKFIYPRIRLVSTYHGWIGNNARQQLYISIDAFISRFYDGVITVSQKIYDRLEESSPHNPKKLLIHNAIVMEDYQIQGHRSHIRKLIGVNCSDYLLGVFGRLSLEKGCYEILSALKILRSHRRDVKLLLIGEGPLENALKQEIENSGLSDVVIRLAYQTNIQKYYEALDLYVNPSLTEGISNVILEAMTFKIPVVATRVGGTPEIITHDHDGFLVPAGSPKAMADAINSLLDAPEIRARMSENSYATVSKNFDFQKRMEKVCNFYDTLFAH